MTLAHLIAPQIAALVGARQILSDPNATEAAKAAARQVVKELGGR
jgi:hypothetical protein